MTDAKDKESPRGCGYPLPQECIEHFERVEAKLDFLTGLLTGNRSPGEGLLIRVDRMEQRWKLTTWVLGVVVGAVVLNLVRTVFVVWTSVEGATQ